jgi:hypothetical protein
VHDTGTAGALGDLSRFRQEFYQCLTARADTLFELAEALPGAGHVAGGVVAGRRAPARARGPGTTV